jgi:hypothetical protein
MYTDDNVPGQNTIARMISGAKPITYMHEYQMYTDDNTHGQKHDFKND